MARVQSFEPIIGHQPRIVILGSMPGVASLEAVEYYAHPRNAFWQIMSELFEIDPHASYAERVQALSRQPVILWDTLQACHRPGSLDANIDIKSARANDFPQLLKRHPQVRAIAFNGAASATYFGKLVAPELPDSLDIEMLKMPSTSPANAGMSFAQKLGAWQRIIASLD